MYKNYFYLCRSVLELNNLVTNNEIVDIYTQAKDKLFIHIPLKNKNLFHLIVSTNPQQHFVTIKEEHHKAKKNTINFFEDYLPSRVISIKYALGDRIIELTLSNSKLYFVFRGGQSNAILLDPVNNLHSFKKMNKEEDRLRIELSSLTYSNSESSIISLIDTLLKESEIRKLPFIGKDIIKEIESRSNDFKKNTHAIIDEILHGEIAVLYDENAGKPIFHPSSFLLNDVTVKSSLFNNYFDAINKYLVLSFSEARIKNVRNEIEKILIKSIDTLTGKLNNLKGRVDSGSKETEYHRYGDLLLGNISLIRKGMNEIELGDYITGEKLKIILDPKLSPNKNIDRYYDKSRSERIEFEKSTKLLKLNDKEYERLIKLRERFERTDDQDELLQIKKELKMKTQSAQEKNKKEKYQFRHYLLENKYHIYVGKDSKNNDILTTRFAKQNDFWFHARSVSGSHVVLKIENTKEAVPKNILSKTASVAAFYSKAKTSKIVSVTYTLKKYVVKNARHEPGQVTVTKEKVLLVKPEIPAGCEIIIE